MIPNRLTARDLRLQLEWLHDEWEPGDVWANQAKITRLRRYLEHVPDPFHAEAKELLDELGRSQLRAGGEWRIVIRKLHNVVNAWTLARPAERVCGFDYGNGRVCQVVYRSETQLRDHQRLIHDPSSDEVA